MSFKTSGRSSSSLSSSSLTDRERELPVMDFLQLLLDLVLQPAGFVFLVLTYPLLSFYNFCQWVLSYLLFKENVRDKVVIVTGASSGIGEQLVYEYAKRGAKLVLVARRDKELNDVAEAARTRGATEVKTVLGDVSREEDCKKLVDETISSYGQIDHLVCNAGIAHCFFVEESAKPDLLQKIIDTNFLGGCVYTTMFALPHLRKTRGKIVAVASTASWLPVPRMAIYNASKAAMVNFFDTLRVELGYQLGGITIAMPGYIKSEMTMGKFMSPDGSVDMKTDARDLLVGPSPVATTEYCARTIVSAALRGRHYVVVPAWYKISLLFRVLAPEMLETLLRFVFVKEVDSGKPLTKATMDKFPELEKVAYPAGMQQKTE